MTVKGDWDWFKCRCSCHMNGTVCTEEDPCCDGLCRVCDEHIVGLDEHNNDHCRAESLGLIKAPEVTVVKTVVQEEVVV